MRAYIAALVMALYIIPTGPLRAAPMEGWSSGETQAMTAGCVNAMVTPARRDFMAAAKRAGDTAAKFPEREVRASFTSLCSCVTREITGRYARDQFMSNPGKYQNVVMSDVIPSGKCKPSGRMGKALMRR